MKTFPFDLYDIFGYLACGLLAVMGLEMTLGVPKVIGQTFTPVGLVALTIGAYVAGQLIDTPAKLILEKLFIKKILHSPSANLMIGSAQHRLSCILPGYYEPLPNAIQEKIIGKTKSEGLESPNDELLFLHIRYRDYIRNDAPLMAKLQSFLNKYGFNRNLSFASLLFGIGVISVNGFDITTDQTKYAIMAIIASALLFIRYLKFFRQYTYELFNTYAGRD